MNKLNLILLLSCIISYNLWAQDDSQIIPFNDRTGKFEYQDVIESSSKSKDELYEIARQWFVTAFNDAEEVIQYESKEEGKIIGKGITKAFIMKYNFSFKFKLVIEMKDGKVRYTLNNIYRMPEKGLSGESLEAYCDKYKDKGKGTQKRLNEFKANLDRNIKALFKSLEAEIANSESEDNW